MGSDVESKLLDYRVRFGIETLALPVEEPDEYVVEIDGVISYEPADEEPVVVGNIKTSSIHGGRALEDHYPIEDVFDATDEVHQLYVALFNPRTRELKRRIQSEFEVCGSDLLYLKTIEILPEHRGRGLGLAVVSRAIDMLSLGLSSLVVCKPFPLQCDAAHRDNAEWRVRMGADEFTADETAAQRKLRSYWGRLGFKLLRGTEYAALSMNLRRPRLFDALALPEA